MANEKVMTTQALIEKFEYALDNHWGYIYGKKHDYWTKEKQEAYRKEYINDPDRKLSAEKGGKWIGHWVTDCSGLFAWAFNELGGNIAHGSNSIWNGYCLSKGKIVNGRKQDGTELKPGTAVFTSNGERHNHIGLYVGGGTVIEAMGTINGVTTTKITNKKWSHWGELKGVDYERTQNQPSNVSTNPADGRPTLRKGDKGSYVTVAQTALINRGYDLGKYGADGDFGSATEKAVKEFQHDNGLTADGVIGLKTWAALDGQKMSLYTVRIPSLPKSKAEALVKEYAGASMTEEGRG